MIDASNMTPENAKGFVRAKKRPVVIDARKMEEPFYVDTLEGRMQGGVGDYLLIGVQGEAYPCAAEIYEATYDEVGVSS